MTTIQLYRKHKAGEVSRESFLYEVRRDNNLPWVTNTTSYSDAVKILKNKGIISELEKPTKIYQDQDDQWETDFMSDLKANMVDPNQADEIVAKAKESMKDHGETLKGMYKMFARPFASRAFLSDFAPEQRKKEAISEIDQNVATDPAVDTVNPYFLKRGVNKLLSKEEELTNDSYKKALNKAAKALKKNPHAFDEEMFANAEDVNKADEKLEMEDVKKGNLNDKDREMKKVKVKSLKEAAIEELTNSLKKKDAINEDVHWKHTVGSEVHTPDGPGIVKEIIGSTLTVELKDGQLKDYQINTIDHHTQKAQEEATMPFADAPLKPEYKMNKDGQRAINPAGIEFKVGDKVSAINNDKETGTISSFKQEQGIIKAGVNKGMGIDTYDIAGLKKVDAQNPWDTFKGRMIPEAIKKYIAKHKDDKEKMEKVKGAVKKLKELIKRNPTTGAAVSTMTPQDNSLATKLGYTQTVPGTITPLGKI